MADDQPILAREQEPQPDLQALPETAPREEIEGELVWSSMDLPGMDPADEHE